MCAIREINPRARLIQTEDLGKTFSTNKLAAQTRFENDRRWLTFDVLCGRLDHRHPLWNYFLSSGITDRELLWYVENPCQPDILGVNHYLTSERFLDHRTELYPAAAIGENGRERYADVEAVRVPIERDLGPGPRLSEIWQRYHLPLAVTEAHLGCSNDEQLRWFYQVWTAAQNLRADGADIRAVTAWALFGSFDWNSLLVRNDNIYEPGVFDIRHAQPRPTPLAQMLQELAAGATPSNPALNDAGWWMRPERVQYPGERFVVTEITDRASAPRQQTNL